MRVRKLGAALLVAALLPVPALAYKYYPRQELARQLALEVEGEAEVAVDGVAVQPVDPYEKPRESILDKQVQVTDEIVKVWKSEASGHWRFETRSFACVVEQDKTDVIDYVQTRHDEAQRYYKDLFDRLKEARNDLEKKGIMSEIHARWRYRPLVTMYATVGRPDLWGEVSGKEADVHTERLVLVVDRVEPPRERHYDEVD